MHSFDFLSPRKTPNPMTSIFTMIRIWVTLGLILSNITLAQRWEPFPICLSCIPQALLDAPGIGLELSDSYGTIAVRFSNGTTVNVDKVEGDKDYKSLMRRLSGAQKQRSPAHLSTLYKLQNILNDPIKHITSRATASSSRSDIDILSKFIKVLRTTTEDYISAKVDLAVATHPSLPLLKRETLEEAFNRAGMSHLRSYKVITRLDSVHQVVSSLAGLGYGICEHWYDSRACEKEDRELPREQALAISFTDDSLAVGNTAVVGPHRFEEIKETVHWDLGFERWRENPADSMFWRRVREAIEKVPVSFRNPDLLLLFGGAALNGKFQEIVKLALENMELPYLYEDWERGEHDTLYLAARGAAEIAKVWQGSEWNCIQHHVCSDVEVGRPKDDGVGVTLRQMYEKRAQWNESCRIGECPWRGVPTEKKVENFK